MISDDTEHTAMVAQALIESAGDLEKFQRSLARQMRVWLFGLPAGTGKATLQACLKLCLGTGPERSGVFSAGNGPAMRSAIIGVCYGSDVELMRTLAAISTRMTHTDPKAEWGALAVALAAHCAATGEEVAPARYYQELQQILGDPAREFLDLVQHAVMDAEAGATVAQFAEHLDLSNGVSGYVLHTVPVALYAWFRHRRDYRTAILELVHCGGDTDSTAAIAGAIIGAGVGREGIPQDWLDALWEWPRNVPWLEAVGQRLAEVCATGTPQHVVPAFFPAVLLRNLCFFGIALGHGLRRALPPY